MTSPGNPSPGGGSPLPGTFRQRLLAAAALLMAAAGGAYYAGVLPNDPSKYLPSCVASGRYPVDLPVTDTAGVVSVGDTVVYVRDDTTLKLGVSATPLGPRLNVTQPPGSAPRYVVMCAAVDSAYQVRVASVPATGTPLSVPDSALASSVKPAAP